MANKRLALILLAMVFFFPGFVSCGGGSGVSSESASSTGSSGDDAAPEGIAFATTAVAGVFQNLGGSTQNLRFAAAESSRDVCGGTASDPDGVESRGYGDAGTYGAAGYDIAVAETDFCTDAGGTDNSGSGPDGDGRFRAFRVSIATASCGGDATKVYLREGAGIYRNTADHFPEIYGAFTVAGTSLDCTIKLNEDGTADEAHCTDGNGDEIVSESGGDCTLTPGVIAPAVSGYKGVWAPALLQGGQSTEDPAVVAELGATFVSVVQSGLVDENGTVTMDFADETMGDKILDYYDYGIGVMVSFDTMYVPTGSDRSSGVPELPGAVAGSQSFQDNLTAAVADLAAFAEEYDAFLFAPYNEADLKMDDEGDYAGDWGQDVIDDVRATYSGLVLWKAGLEPTGIDFTGYDIAGTSLSRMSNESETAYAERVDRTIETLNSQAASAGVATTLVSEFGVWGDASDAFDGDQIARSYEIVFEQGETDVDGFIAFDGPDGYDPPLYDDDGFVEDGDAFDVVRDWFTNQL